MRRDQRGRTVQSQGLT